MKIAATRLNLSDSDVINDEQTHMLVLTLCSSAQLTKQTMVLGAIFYTTSVG